jgi:hypothetical protein
MPIFNNPEWQRFIWVEAHPRRLITALAVLLAMAGAVYLTGYNVFSNPSDAGRITLPFPLASLYAIGIIFGLWGTRTIVASVLDEVREGLWDLHRLSGLTPWQMVTGRLFGACSLVWLCGGLLTMLLVAHGLVETQASFGALILRAAIILLIGLGTLAAALTQALMLTAQTGRRLGSVLAQIVGLGVMIGLVFHLKLMDFLLNTEQARISLPISASGQYFYGDFIDGGWYRLGVTAIYAFAFVIAAWRAMYCARQLPPPPLGLPLGGGLFALLVTFHGAALEPYRGYFDHRHIGWGLMAMTIAMVYGVFFGHGHPLRWRHWGNIQRWSRRWALLPSWVLPFIFYVFFSFWLVLFQQSDVARALRPALMPGMAPGWSVVLVGVLFAARDLALVMALSVGFGWKQPLGATCVVLGVIYGLSMLFNSIDLNTITALLAWPWQPAFNSDIAMGISRVPMGVVITGAAAATIQIVVASGWIVYQLRPKP